MLIRNSITALLISVALTTGNLFAITDPTKPPEFSEPTEAPTSHALKLSMIIREGNTRRAVINETVVEVADDIERATVMAIKRESVILRRGDETIVLEMPLAEVRKEREHE